MQGFYAKVGHIKTLSLVVFLAFPISYLLLNSSVGYGLASRLKTEISGAVWKESINGGAARLADVVPFHCLASNTKWLQCIQEVRMSARESMTMCRAYKECDHTLADLNDYDATCRDIVPTDRIHRVACCVDIWWASGGQVELRYATATTGIFGGHLSSSCAVNLMFLDSEKTSHNFRNGTGGLGGTGGPVVIIKHNPNDAKDKLVTTIKDAREAGATRVGVVVYGDEWSKLEPQAYHDADFLFRNYEDSRDRKFLAHFTSVDEIHQMRLLTKSPNAGNQTRSKASGRSLGHNYWLPLFYTEGVFMEMTSFTPSRPASARKNLWFFKGWLSDSSRTKLVEMLKADEKLMSMGVLGTTQSWATGGGLEYARTMLDTAFALSPKGQSYDTFRTWEALSFGAIPVLQVQDKANNPYRFFGKNPIPTVKDWAELPALLFHYYEHPEEMVKLQSDCVRWWKRLSDAYSRQMALEVLAGFDSQLLDK